MTTNEILSSEPARIVACPTCKKSVAYDLNNRWRPFCCERCRLIDLGEWASESRRIPAQNQQLDDEA